ncbi:ATP-binding protein [Oharaeibacter diazotrophicus]|nr:ATP-binding protein [Oharaeibacter diazotrophicus]GLS76367.1 hybrid sensor histidine kinase/response regulator [Oharaeibacter diazotrophicus]
MTTKGAERRAMAGAPLLDRLHLPFGARTAMAAVGAVAAMALLALALLAARRGATAEAMVVASVFALVLSATAFVLGRGTSRGVAMGASTEAASVEAGAASLDESADLVVRFDRHGRIVEASHAVGSLFGGDAAALVGVVRGVFAAALVDGELAAVAEARTRIGRPPLVHWQAIRAQLVGRRPEAGDGDARTGGVELAGDVRIVTAAGMRWYAFMERPDGRGDGRVLVGRDVTDRKAIEAALSEARDQAEAASAAKSRFLAMVSHEIRTPLNGILGMTGLLMQTPLTQEQRTYARAVETSGEALLILIEDLLDFSKIEADRLDLQVRPVALDEIVEELVELLAPRAAAKGIELAAYVDPRLPRSVVADPIRLKQVLFNLTGNGIKFTAEGGVAVEVGPVSGDAPDVPGHAVRFMVRDTGIGIAPEDRERIFREFEQADPGPTRSYGGTGLGLAIARRLVRLMGGDVSVEGAPGAGTCFSFVIPLPASEAADISGGSSGEPAYVPPEASGDVPLVGARAAQAALFARIGHARGRRPVVPDAWAGDAVLAGRRILVVSNALIEGPLLVRRLYDAGAEATLVAPRDLEAALVDAARHHAVVVDAAAGDAFALLDRVRAVSQLPAGVLIDPRQRPLLPDLSAAGYGAYLVKPVRARSLVLIVRTLLGEVGFDAAEAAVREPTPRRSAAARRTVLLCDDNEINALLGRGLLEKLGHAVTVTTDGRRAVALVEASLAGEVAPFDLVLMDLHMPEMDGREAARRIRAVYERAGMASARIVAVTADLHAEPDASDAASLFDGWLSKPIDPAALREAAAEL